MVDGSKQEASMTCGRYLRTVAACVLLLVLSGCHAPGTSSKLFYINSHHPGEASSDEVMAGMYEVVADSRARLDVFFMDAKRCPDRESIDAKTEEVLQIIRQIEPDVIIASDDNAVKFVVAQHFKNGPIPCVFCGVDWTCEPYGLPTEHVTGMLEVPPVREAVETLKRYYPEMKNLVVLSANTASTQQARPFLDSLFAQSDLTSTYAFVETYDEWRTEFLKANREADVIYLATGEAIRDWDQADAEAFVAEYIHVPVFTCDASMVRCTVFGLTTAPREQGRWAAKTALRILRGKSPARIPVVEGQETKAHVNMALADRIGFEPDDDLLDRRRRRR